MALVNFVLSIEGGDTSNLPPMQQPSILQEILLRTDGTVTHILEACAQEAIGIVNLSQEERVWDAADPYLELEQDSPVLVRSVLLKGLGTGRTMMYADSIMVLDRLEPSFAAAIRNGDRPIGPLLAEGRTETFREILRIDQEPAGLIASFFGVETTSNVFLRTYRIIAGGRPLMCITEKFPVTAFQHVASISDPARVIRS